MADTVTSQVLLNGPRDLVMKFTNESDSTGESGVTKVDATSTLYANTVQGNVVVPGVHLKVTKVVYDIKGMGLRILWDATADTDMLVLGGYGTMDFKDIGGLQNPNNTGATGSILFTTVGAASGSSYSVILYMTKGVPQS